MNVIHDLFFGHAEFSKCQFDIMYSNVLVCSLGKLVNSKTANRSIKEMFALNEGFQYKK